MEAHIQSHGAGMQALRFICLSGSLFYRNPAPVEADRLRTSEDDERKLILSHTALAGSPSGSFVYQGTCFIKIWRRLRQTGFEHRKTVNGGSSSVTRFWRAVLASHLCTRELVLSKSGGG